MEQQTTPYRFIWDGCHGCVISHAGGRRKGGGSEQNLAKWVNENYSENIGQKI